MSPQAKWEYMKVIYQRYYKAKSRRERSRILDEFCQTYRCHRKHALRLMNGPTPTEKRPARKRRKALYGARIISILESIWESSGYLWSRRLKAALPLWMPWIKQRFHLTPLEEQQLLKISPAQIDRRLTDKKHHLRKIIYGKTKPGSLLKHQIPIQTESWNIKTPGYIEADLVSHSGNSAFGHFTYTLDMTDLATGWVERRAFLGKSQEAVCHALSEIQQSIPFRIRGFDCDNDSAFINEHLMRYCRSHNIQFTRSRPYKKDDNAHIEQKNWTHVRQLLGYLRYDTPEAVKAMNDLYRNELRIFQNLFQPSVKLIRKVRLGSKIKKFFADPKTPFERLQCYKQVDAVKLNELQTLMKRINPFTLSDLIDEKLHRIHSLASRRPPYRSPYSTNPWNQYLYSPQDHYSNHLPTEIFKSSPIEQFNQIVQKEKLLQIW